MKYTVIMWADGFFKWMVDITCISGPLPWIIRAKDKGNTMTEERM
jgi:hypothetical protein